MVLSRFDHVGLVIGRLCNAGQSVAVRWTEMQGGFLIGDA